METITKLKNETFRQLSKEIARLDDKAFKNSNIDKTKARLFDKLKIKKPEFAIEETIVTIGTEKVVKYDSPKGASPGQDIYFALYVVPVKGEQELFLRILGRHFWNDNFYCADNKVFFKKMSLVKIVENALLIEKIKKQAEVRFNKIIQMLDNFHLLAEEFNAAELTTEINTKVDAEKIRRETQKSTETALKPCLS